VISRSAPGFETLVNAEPVVAIPPRRALAWPRHGALVRLTGTEVLNLGARIVPGRGARRGRSRSSRSRLLRAALAGRRARASGDLIAAVVWTNAFAAPQSAT
jgi:hypothetical protein